MPRKKTIETEDIPKEELEEKIEESVEEKYIVVKTRKQKYRIFFDEYCFKLQRQNDQGLWITVGYYGDLEYLARELLNIRIKAALHEGKRILDAIKEAQEAVTQIFKKGKPTFTMNTIVRFRKNIEKETGEIKNEKKKDKKK